MGKETCSKDDSIPGNEHPHSGVPSSDPSMPDPRRPYHWLLQAVGIYGLGTTPGQDPSTVEEALAKVAIPSVQIASPTRTACYEAVKAEANVLFFFAVPLLLFVGTDADIVFNDGIFICCFSIIIGIVQKEISRSWNSPNPSNDTDVVAAHVERHRDDLLVEFHADLFLGFGHAGDGFSPLKHRTISTMQDLNTAVLFVVGQMYRHLPLCSHWRLVVDTSAG